MGDIGYLHAVQLARRLTPAKCIMWFAPVCSTWVFINLATSLRSKHRPEGDESRKTVRQGNAQVWRMLFLILFTLGLQAEFIIEQPTSSVMIHHPALKFLKRILRALGRQLGRTHTWLGMYGANSRKGVQLFSNAKWVSKLKVKLDTKKAFSDKTVSRHYLCPLGIVRTCGGPGLKATQAYPPRFGDRVGELFSKRSRAPKPCLPVPALADVTERFEEELAKGVACSGIRSAADLTKVTLPASFMPY